MGSYAGIIRHKISSDRLCYLFLIFLIGCLSGWICEVLEPAAERRVRGMRPETLHHVCLTLLSTPPMCAG